MFAGDTIHVLARLKGVRPEQMCTYTEYHAGIPNPFTHTCPSPYTFPISFELENGDSGMLTQVLYRRPDSTGGAPDADLLDRLLVAGSIAAARHGTPVASVVKHLTDEALRCQLMSPWTSCLVVARRAEGEKTDGQPKLKRIGQMMAAGSHGFASVHAFMTMAPAEPMMRMSYDRAPCGTPDLMDIAGWTVAQLSALGVPEALLAELRRLVDAGADENEICLLCLHAMLKARRKLTGLGRDRARDVRQAAKALGVDADLVRQVEMLVTQWG
jgi:hypothetical protein